MAQIMKMAGKEKRKAGGGKHRCRERRLPGLQEIILLTAMFGRVWRL
jgi:hypothetical protein